MANLVRALLPVALLISACKESPRVDTDGGGSASESICLSEIGRYQGQESLVYDVAWSPDGTRLLTGSTNLLRLFSVSGAGALTLLDSVSSETRFNSVQWSPDGAYALAPSGRYLRMFSVSSEGTLAEVEQGPLHPAELQRVALSPDGRRVLSCDVEGVTHLYDVDFVARSLVERAAAPAHTRCTRVAWSPSGTLALSAGRGPNPVQAELALYRVGETTLSVTDALASMEETGEAIFGRNDTEAVGGSFGTLNTLWYLRVNPEAGTLSAVESQDLHASGIGALEWSHSGEYLLTGAHDHATHILERRADGLGLRSVSDQFNDGTGVHSARWSPDDGLVAKTSSNLDLLTLLEVVACTAAGP